MTGSDCGSKRWLGMARSEVFTVLFALAFVNALLPTIVTSIAISGIWFSMANTFGVSAVVWGAFALGISYSMRIDGCIVWLDKVVAAIVVVGCFSPIGPGMWLLLWALGIYCIWTAPVVADWRHRAGWVFVALTVPMFWSKRLFSIFSEYFLAVDASLVSAVLNTRRDANLVAIPGQGGFLQIAPACSSMANVSLAILCWVLFTQASGVRWRPSNVVWCAVACCSVIVINATRISLIGFFPDKYYLLHGPIGSTVCSWLTVVVVVLICYAGIGRGKRVKYI